MRKSIIIIVWTVVLAVVTAVWTHTILSSNSVASLERVVGFGQPVHSSRHLYEIGGSTYRLQQKDSREIILLGESQRSLICKFAGDIVSFGQVFHTEQHLVKESGEGELLKRVLLTFWVDNVDLDAGKVYFGFRVRDLGWDEKKPETY